MGFLTFLKKGEPARAPAQASGHVFSGSQMPHDDLELPPPPKIGASPSDLPSFPGPKFDSVPVQNFDVPPLVVPEKQGDFSTVPEINPAGFGSSIKYVPEPVQELIKPVEQKVVPPPVEEKHEAAISEGPVYVKASRFRAIVEDIDSMVATVRLVDETLANIRKQKDDEYDKWSRDIEDVQRTLMFVDKTLFEVQE